MYTVLLEQQVQHVWCKCFRAYTQYVQYTCFQNVKASLYGAQIFKYSVYVGSKIIFVDARSMKL